MNDPTLRSGDNGCALVVHRDDELAEQSRVRAEARGISVKRVISMKADSVRLEAAQLRGYAYDWILIVTKGFGEDDKTWIRKNKGDAAVHEIDSTEDCWRALENRIAGKVAKVANRPFKEPEDLSNAPATVLRKVCESQKERLVAAGYRIVEAEQKTATALADAAEWCRLEHEAQQRITQLERELAARALPISAPAIEVHAAPPAQHNGSDTAMILMLISSGKITAEQALQPKGK